jgi:hypothetical protein
MASRRLSSYRAKRDFSRTAEPSGSGTVADPARLRFGVQKHAARRLHYDLRLERQHGGGTVQIWDRGCWRPQVKGTPEEYPEAARPLRPAIEKLVGRNIRSPVVGPQSPTLERRPR